MAVAYAAAGLTGALPPALLGGVFVPFALGFEFVIQARESFCARLAYLGRYDFPGTGAGDGDGETDCVADPTDRRADRLRAARITAVAVAAAAAATLAIVFAA